MSEQNRGPLTFSSTLRKPSEEVEAIVRFAMENVDASDVVVRVKNSAKHGYHGRAYNGIPRHSPARNIPGAHYLVVLRLCPSTRFPIDNTHIRWRWTSWMPPEADRPANAGDDWFGQFRHDRRGKITGVRWGRVVSGPYGGRGSPSFEVYDWREALVVMAAHEIRHIEQFRFDLRHSEVDAERAAAAALARWRARDDDGQATTGRAT